MAKKGKPKAEIENKGSNVVTSEEVSEQSNLPRGKKPKKTYN